MKIKQNDLSMHKLLCGSRGKGVLQDETNNFSLVLKVPIVRNVWDFNGK